MIRTLLKTGEQINICSSKRHYHKIQIDELHSFVRKKKVWIIYAYDAETNEIIAITAEKNVIKSRQTS